MTIEKAYEMFIKYCKNIKLSQHTINSYVSDSKMFQNYLRQNDIDPSITDVNEITKVTLKGYFAEQQGKYETSTVKKRHATLSSFYRWLVEEQEYINYNLVHTVHLKFKHETKRQTVLRSSDMTDLMNVFSKVPNRRRNFRYYRNLLIMQLMYSCGVRVGEIVKLTHDSYDDSDHSFTMQAKGDKFHKIFIGDKDMLDLYKKVKEMNPFDTIMVFPNRYGGLLTTQSVREMINNFSKDADIEKHITPHCFRRGCATALIESGVDVAIVKDVLGHADIATTMRYVQLSDKVIQDVMNTHNPMSRITQPTN